MTTKPSVPAVDPLPALQSIGLAITVLRGQRVILDAELAALYGVQTKRFNEAVKRNAQKFPPDSSLMPSWPFTPRPVPCSKSVP